jgi:hypothetical protein
MILTIKALFTEIRRLSDNSTQIRLSYMEIYNEMVKDLINMGGDVLELREDPIRGVVIAGLSETVVTSPAEVM